MHLPGLETRASLSAPGISEECMSFEWNGLRLRGVLSLSETPSGTGFVTVHGWASNRGGPSGLLVKMCRRAAAEGAAALRFDLPGRGESDGEYGDVSLDDMIDAAGAAAEALRDRGGLSRVALAGICSGANTALAAAALEGGRIGTVLALSALPYQEDRGSGQRLRRSLGNIGKMLRKAARLSTWKRLLQGEIDLGGVGKAVSAKDAALKDGRNLKKSRRDIPSALAAYEGRVTLVWGSADPEAGVSEAYFREVLRAGVVETRHLEGANHNFYSDAWHQEIMGEVSRLLAEGRSADTIKGSRKGLSE